MLFIDIQVLSIFWIAIAVIILPILTRLTAPYGRHARSGWGPMINNVAGWVIMELVSPVTFAFFFLTGSTDHGIVNWCFFAFWIFHYLNRSLIYPLRLKNKSGTMPLSVVLMAVFFNSVNGFLNGYFLGAVMPHYPDAWLVDPRFILGVILFFFGWFVNFQSDEILRNLRKPGETGYKIPRGAFFRWISCPNYFGEIVEWFGFALMCWSLPALSFAIWTAANLLPRAISHHKWYLQQFDDYPADRKAIIPGLI